MADDAAPTLARMLMGSKTERPSLLVEYLDEALPKAALALPETRIGDLWGVGAIPMWTRSGYPNWSNALYIPEIIGGVGTMAASMLPQMHTLDLPGHMRPSGLVPDKGIRSKAERDPGSQP